MARLKSFVENLTGGLWFVPLVMTVGGAALFGLSYSLDLRLGSETSGLPAFLGGPGSARSLLSNVAGSLVTVMATLFSIIKGSHDETMKVLGRLEDLTGEPEHSSDESNLPSNLPAKTVRSEKSGYLVYLDVGDLVKDLARTQAEVVAVESALWPGDFVTAGLPLARVRGEVGARARRFCARSSCSARSAPSSRTLCSASASSWTWRSRASRRPSTTRR